MRIDPDPDGSEFGMLAQYLDYQRETGVSLPSLVRHRSGRRHRLRGPPASMAGEGRVYCAAAASE